MVPRLTARKFSSSLSRLVKSASVEESYHLSDHSLIVHDLQTGSHHRLVELGGSIRLIRLTLALSTSIDTLHRCATTADSFTTQLEEVVSNLLDTVAPPHAICMLNIRPLCCLSPQAVKAKQERRVFEHQLKRTNKEEHRVVYCEAYRKSNRLIN